MNCQAIPRITCAEKYGTTSTLTGKKVNMTSFASGLELATSLMMPWLKTRPLMGLKHYHMVAAHNMSGDERFTKAEALCRDELIFPITQITRVCCRQCQREIQGAPNNKENKKDLKGHKSNTCCEMCGEVLCKNHIAQICLSKCLPKLKL